MHTIEKSWKTEPKPVLFAFILGAPADRQRRNLSDPKRGGQGFSLLEMLLVVALIGILAAYAVPTYQGYMQQTRFMEVVQQTQSVRISQAACLMTVGQELSACDSFAELALQAPLASDNTASVSLTTSTAIITGTGTSAAGGYTYLLTPSYNAAGQLDYSVSGTCVAAGAC